MEQGRERGGAAGAANGAADAASDAPPLLHPHIANMLAMLGDATDGACPFVHAVLQYSDGGSLKRWLMTPPTSTHAAGSKP